MKIPSEIVGIVTPKQWARIDPGRLPEASRDAVLRIVTNTLKREDPEAADPEDVEEFVEYVEGMVGELSEDPPDVDEGDMEAAEGTSDAVLEDMAGEGEE